jgi:hypothetical protein
MVASAAQPVPKVTNLSREWYQRGTTNELEITGENLGEPKSVHISGDPGVSVILTPLSPSKPRVQIETSGGGIALAEGKESSRLRAQVVTAPDASLNVRELRVITRTGVSNPFRINVSPLREILEERTGTEPQKIELPVGVSGAISAPGEQDSYLLTAEKGQQLVVDVLAFRVGSPLDSSLAILSPSGKELARNEDAKGFDSFLQFSVPESGEYLIQLRDFRYTGSPAHKYHLTVGALPYINSAFPAGAQRGQQVDISLKGINLGGVDQLRLEPEKSAPLGWQELRVRTDKGLSSAFPFQVGDVAEFMEAEPNNTSNEANVVTVPITINGRMNVPKDIDTYKVKLDRTQTLVCEVTAQRFGSPLDALLTLRDASGKVLRQNDDANGADARLEFEFQKDHEYVLSIRDLLGRGGDDYVYRLSIRRPEPDFSLRFSPDNPRLNCGGRAILHCELTRKAGFSGAVRVTCEGLPAGVSAEPVLINPDDSTQTVLVFTANSNAAGGAFPIKLLATAMIQGQFTTRTAEPVNSDVPAKECLLSVVESPPPFTVELNALNLTLEQEQAAELPVNVQRFGSFQGEIKLRAEGYTAVREPLEDNLEATQATLKPGETNALVKLKARDNAEPARRPVYIQAEGTADGHSFVQYSEAVPLTIRQIPFSIFNTMKRVSVAVLPAGAQSAASEAEFAIRATRHGWFTDQINLSLEGLPEGITAISTNLPSHVDEAGFKLVTTPKAPTGKEFQITVVGSATIGGRTYHQRTTPMTLTITAPQDIADTK